MRRETDSWYLVIYGGTYQAGRAKEQVKSNFTWDKLQTAVGTAVSLGVSIAEHANGISAAKATLKVKKVGTVSTNSVTVKKVAGAKSYLVYTSTDNKNWTKKGSTAKTTLTLTKLTGGKKLYVKVIAVNAYGANSAASAVKSVTVKK